LPEKFTTVRLSIAGEQFEVLVRPESALSFKRGGENPIQSVIAFEEIYSEASKGLRVSDDKLKKSFGTTDVMTVAERIIRDGDLQLTTEQRRKMIEEKRKQVVTYISKNFIDPKTRTPHPPVRVERAMVDAKVHIDPFKDATEQSKSVVESLRAIIPLKTEQIKFKIIVPAQYAPQSFGVLKTFGQVQDEIWGADGTLTATIEVSAGARASLLDKLGSLTRGSAQALEIR
jgi:ribosome maturation protein SDO1